MSSDPTKTKFIPMSTGEALPAEDLRAVTARDATTVVLLAGPVGCGKTTMIVGLYELFNEGPVGGLLFAGSATLAGFERICHPGRVVSGSVFPDTLRTNPSSGAAFLHLRVAEIGSGTTNISSVLISDVTGEAFNEARDASEPTILPSQLWRQAGMICVVLDGQMMSIATKRQLVRSYSRSLLRSAHESEHISRNCRLAIVTTKWDQVAVPDTELFVRDTEAMLLDQYGSDFTSVSLHHIAARPSSDRIPYAYGLPSLLKEWVSRPPSKPAFAIPKPVKGDGLNDFARLFWEHKKSSLSEILDVI